MTDTLTPTETIAAIEEHRARAAIRRDELIAERRSLTSSVLTGGPAAQAKVNRVSNELRNIEETLEELKLTERQAHAAIAVEDGADREARKVAVVYAIDAALKMRDVLAEGIDAKLADLLADLRKFDAISLDVQHHACRYGRPDTIAYLTPKRADELLFDRLVAMESLPAMVGSAPQLSRETIADVSRIAGSQLLYHLAELLPPEKRPRDTRTFPAQPAPVKAAPVEEDEEEFVDDLPALEEV